MLPKTCIFSRGEECKCQKKSSHNVHLLVLVHNISRLYVEVGDHNLVLAPTSILAVIYSSELEKVSLDFWSGVVVFLIRHHHVTFKSSELERYGDFVLEFACMQQSRAEQAERSMCRCQHPIARKFSSHRRRTEANA